MKHKPSVNRLVQPLVKELVDNAEKLRVEVSRLDNGCTVVDAGSDEAAEKLAVELPSATSKDYGKPFAEVFKEYEYDFFKIDPMLFSPASVIVSAVDSGRSFHGGRLDVELLEKSFGA